MSRDDHPSRRSRLPRLLHCGARHEWSQQHLSHYVDGDLNWLARRGLEVHADQCPECSLGIRAVRTLVRLMHGAADGPSEPAPAASSIASVPTLRTATAVLIRPPRRDRPAVESSPPTG